MEQALTQLAVKILFDASTVFVCLCNLILYVPSTIFQLLCRDRSSWVEPVLSYDECVLLKDTTQCRR